MNKKPVIITAVGASIVTVMTGGIYFSPYLTLNNLKKATNNRNAEALSQEIDFPSLRNSVKANIKSRSTEQFGKSIADPALIEKLVNSRVEKLVSPEGLDKLMQDKIPEAILDFGDIEKNIAESKIQMGYESIDRFVVHITNKTDPTKNVSLILKRDGLAWKLSGIDISKV
jgi:hypothetical protein